MLQSRLSYVAHSHDDQNQKYRSQYQIHAQICSSDKPHHWRNTCADHSSALKHDLFHRQNLSKQTTMRHPVHKHDRCHVVFSSILSTTSVATNCRSENQLSKLTPNSAKSFDISAKILSRPKSNTTLYLRPSISFARIDNRININFFVTALWFIQRQIFKYLLRCNIEIHSILYLLIARAISMTYSPRYPFAGNINRFRRINQDNAAKYWR